VAEIAVVEAADAVEIAVDVAAATEADAAEIGVDAAETVVVAIETEAAIAEDAAATEVEGATTTAQKLAARLSRRRTRRADLTSLWESQWLPKCRIVFLAASAERMRQ
jgi:hypothetical protein